VYSTVDGSVAVGENNVRTLCSSATPPQRRKSMQVVLARARTEAATAFSALRSRDREGDGEMAGGQTEDSDTNVLTRRW